VHVDVANHVSPANVATEAARLEKKCAGLRKSHTKVLGRTNGARYAMASPAVHAADAQTLENLTSQLNDLESTIAVYVEIGKLAAAKE
jgi:hypothetical protein